MSVSGDKHLQEMVSTSWILVLRIRFEHGVYPVSSGALSLVVVVNLYLSTGSCALPRRRARKLSLRKGCTRQKANKLKAT